MLSFPRKELFAGKIGILRRDDLPLAFALQPCISKDGKPEPRCLTWTCEEARQRAHARAETPAFAVALRKRRKVEALFSELKNLIGLRRLRLRRIKFVREQFYLAAVAQNLKRLVRFLNMRAQAAMAIA